MPPGIRGAPTRVRDNEEVRSKAVDRTVLSVVLADWTRRVGPQAAAHRVAYYRLMLHAWLAAMAGTALVIVGGFGGGPLFVYLGIIGVVGWALLSVAAFVQLRSMNGAASQALGTPIRFFRTPPGRQDRYRSWCQKRGLAPYPFPDAVPPPVRVRWF